MDSRSKDPQGKERSHFRYEPGKYDESEVITFLDSTGNEEKAINIEGIKINMKMFSSGFIPDFRENLKKIKAMECREDDVYICAFMKAGTHWVSEITHMLLNGKAEYEKSPKEENMLEFHWPEEFDRPSPRVLNTHLPFRLLPDQVKKNKSRVIFVQRNPKSISVSAYFHYSGMKWRSGAATKSFSDFLKDFVTEGSMMSTWFDYTTAWETALSENKDLDVTMMYFEDIKKDPMAEIKKLAKFLKVDLSDELCNQIIEKCDFQNLKKANEEIKQNPNPEMGDQWKTMYRKGEIADWKNHYTVADNEYFDAVFAEKMKNSKFTYKFE